MSNYQVLKNAEGDFVTMAEGIMRKTLVFGDKTLLCKFQFDRGAIVPMHSHPYEQTGYLLSGKLIFTIDGKIHEVNAGDSWSIKADVEHGAEVPEPTTLIEVFTPIREDYL
jgi:quercetin dioxygenase-like cupin family protein